MASPEARALAALLIEKGIISAAEFLEKVESERREGATFTLLACRECGGNRAECDCGRCPACRSRFCLLSPEACEKLCAEHQERRERKL